MTKSHSFELSQHSQPGQLRLPCGTFFVDGGSDASGAMLSVDFSRLLCRRVSFVAGIAVHTRLPEGLIFVP